MNDFRVAVTTILSVDNHPDADRLSINTLDGFTTVSNKVDGEHRYRAGDLVAYIPEGSLLPEWLVKHMDCWDAEKGKGILEGPAGNRVKAKKFRGVRSIGMLYPIEEREPGTQDYFISLPIVSDEGEYNGTVKFTVHLGDDVAKYLGITEYVR